MSEDLKIKTRFFALYGERFVEKIMPSELSETNQIDNYWLNIKPLSELTDEDAYYIGRLVYTETVPKTQVIQLGRDYVSYNFDDKPLSNHRSSKLREFDYGFTQINCIDFLRSKGYALPFMEYDVATLILKRFVKPL